MYTEESLKEWISQRIPKGAKSLSISIRNSKTIQEALLFYTSDYEDLTLSARASIVYKGYRPKCVVCGTDTYFNRNRWEFGETCSVKCGANNKRRNDQIKKTLLETYGVDNISKSGYFHEKMKDNNINKYGVEHYFQSEDYRKKNKKTLQEKYNVDCYLQSDDYKEKYKKKMVKSYGVEHFSQTDEFKFKYKNTSIEKYGTAHPMQNIEVFEKQQKNSYYYKDYVMPSGKVVRIQGYEDKALDELLLTYHEDDLVISNKDIFTLLGSFEYVFNGNAHRYYPDIYIKSENRVIEVKSTRTFAVNKKKNFLKRDSVLAKNLGFEFWIYGKRKKII
jgi:hypothetical protein